MTSSLDRRHVTLGGRIALVGGDLDDPRDTPLLALALEARGIVADAVSWRDAGVDWSTYDLVLLRFCWDYVEDLAAFMAWMRHVSAKVSVLNPPDLVAWNASKTYLIDLARQGIPVVPTTLVEVGASVDVLTGLEGEIVVKPAVGTGSRMVARHTRGETSRALSHVQALHRRRQAALVQPHLESIARQGEVGIYVIDGHATHMIRKSSVLEANVGPREDFELSFRHRVDVAPLQEGFVSFAENVVRTLPGGPPLYARVDVVNGQAGPLLLELELIEPVLFLDRVGASVIAEVASAIACRVAT